MSLWEAISSAMKAIWANKMRSFLTMLGIIIGIFAVTLLISMSESASSTITESIEGMGSDLITVFISNKRIDLNLKDINELSDMDGIGKVSPHTSSSMTVKNGSSYMENLQVEGVNADYDDIRNYELSAGRFISENDDSSRLRVAVIGLDVADELYPSQNPVGQKININGTSFTVIGLLEEQGDTVMGSGDEIVMIPFATGQRLMKNARISTIYVGAADSDSVEDAMSSIDSFMSRHSNEEDSYKAFSQSSILDALNEATAVMTALLGGIAGISLLVGGIGIMNIMLVSVTERTREIGIRKAIGATRANILSQFLIEAIFVSGLGGILGIVLARLGANIAGPMMDMTITIQSSVIVLALAFSMSVGVLFGMYPAYKASKLNPIEALRYE